MYTSVEVSGCDKEFVEKAFFHAAALFDILFNYRGKADGIVISLKVPSLKFFHQLQLVEKVYCALAAAALFVIYFNNMDEAQHGMPTLLTPPWTWTQGVLALATKRSSIDLSRS